MKHVDEQEEYCTYGLSCFDWSLYATVVDEIT